MLTYFSSDKRIRASSSIKACKRLSRSAGTWRVFSRRRHGCLLQRYDRFSMLTGSYALVRLYLPRGAFISQLHPFNWELMIVFGVILLRERKNQNFCLKIPTPNQPGQEKNSTEEIQNITEFYLHSKRKGEREKLKNPNHRQFVKNPPKKRRHRLASETGDESTGKPSPGGGKSFEQLQCVCVSFNSNESFQFSETSSKNQGRR